jgi:hypothetical protein
MSEINKRKIRVTKQRDVRTHAEFWHTSNCLLRTGQDDPKGSAHQFRASLVFRAFALEAFLNWLGQELIPHWKYLERIKPKEKLDILCELVQVKPDYGVRPWQIMKELFGFRNDVAHGKPVILNAETFEDMGDYLDGNIGQTITTDWEQYCTQENAVKAKRDVEEIAEMLYKSANMRKKAKGPIGPFAFGFQIDGASLNPS